LKKTLPYTDWGEGDMINIDTDKTHQCVALNQFSFYDNVAYLNTTRWESKYLEMVRAKDAVKSILETDRDKWRTKFYDKSREYINLQTEHDD
jgi:hypothetical protein